ncbi:MAG: lysostaphin resistance A-like protein [Candidatus Pacearchaeota archaeon]
MAIIGDLIISIANLIVVLSALLIYTLKDEILAILKTPYKKQFKEFMWRFKIGRISWKNIGLSIAILFFLDFTIMTLTNTVWPPEEKLVSPGFILSSFIAPIGEEFLFRGLIFGVFLLLLVPKAFKALNLSENLDKNKLYIAFALVLQSIFFTIIHKNPQLVNFLIRFAGGMIYGFLYVLNNYNLLPAIITHLAHNLFINSGLYLEIGQF